MDESYDFIVLGTGLTECIISSLLSINGKKVLHLDRNQHYGGEAASLDLKQIYEKFRPGVTPPEEYGNGRDWCIDLIPKFSMAYGLFTDILYYTKVTRYVNLVNVKGSYVARGGRIYKVPATQAEAITSPLLNIFEKRRLKKFLEFIQKYDLNDPSTHSGIDLKVDKTEKVFSHFSLSSSIQELVGHALALHINDDYLQEPALDTYERICLHVNSINRYGCSPYIYPLYGLGEFPQGFSRLSAIHGGTYMLDTQVDEILYDDDGGFVGIRSGNSIAKADACISDPSYFITKVIKKGMVVRSICILDHPVHGTNNADSVQIIVPQKQVNRTNDIYIIVLSSENKVCPPGYWIAILSTVVETDNPLSELDKAKKIIEPIHEQFTSVVDTYKPINTGQTDRVFISMSYDSTSHFESTCADVLSLYKRITGEDLNIEGIKRRDLNCDEEEEE